ncbi:MAG TPA: class I SAM-dependent methyltransferase, partial [Novosphingobium sp.]|nr:class I SAM-dependent methyltransferase [Novosphingobium sp.]
PKSSHEERSRQEFAKGLRGYIQREVLPGLTPLHKKVAGNLPGTPDRHAIRKAMVREPYFQSYAALNRTAQELLWAAVIDSIERQGPVLAETAGQLEGSVGSLHLAPDMEVPRYVTALDIHCMPGGYASTADATGIAAGALYDRGVYLYAMGYVGPYNDDKGRSVCNYIKRKLPDFAPRRILDMGCTVGHSTLPYKELFPDAELWGIDVAGPVVKYAHLRAAGMGYDVNFAQMNAEQTDFPDGHFDLVVSHIMLHETSAKAMPRIFAECHRLLAPGGYMIHADLPPFDLMDPFTQFILDNETYYNNEPFWGAMRDLDQVALAKAAGFPPETIRFDTAPMAIKEFATKQAAGYSEDAAEAIAEREFTAGEFAPGGGWEVLIARKAVA